MYQLRNINEYTILFLAPRETLLKVNDIKTSKKKKRVIQKESNDVMISRNNGEFSTEGNRSDSEKRSCHLEEKVGKNKGKMMEERK